MPANLKKKLLNKQMPTMLGLGILIVALVAGLLFFGEGTGVFAPRADASVTPKKIKLSNVTDKSFTVSFFTDGETAGFVKYGEEEGSLDSQASDDRDQLSGSIGEFNMHHITIRGLKANTTYYYVLGTSGSNTFDNNGQKFSVKTAANPSTPPPIAKTVYGNVLTPGGTPAEGAIVYISIEGVGLLSSLVKASGSWAMPLSNARTADGSDFAQIEDITVLNIVAQGNTASLVSNMSTTVAQGQPVENIKLGESGSSVPADEGSAATPSGSSEATPSADTATQSADLVTTVTPTVTAAASSSLLDAIEDEEEAPSSTASSILYLNEAVSASNSVTTSTPVFSGQVLPNVEVQVEIHSDNQIATSVTTDSNGEFQLNLEELSQELEPGEHTITLTYADPDTGEDVTSTYTFTVEDTSNLLAQTSTADTSTPYGTGSPYPMSTPTATPTPTLAPTITTPTPTSVATESATTKGGVSTRSAMVATDSGVYTAGSVGTTLALVVGGLFFIVTGVWSWWVSNQLGTLEVTEVKELE